PPLVDVTRSGESIAGAAVATPTARVAVAAAGAGSARLAGLGLIDRQGPALERLVIERLDGRLGLVRGGHLNEAEAAGAAGIAVHDDLGPSHGAVALEELQQVVGRAAPGEIAHVDVRHTEEPFRAGGNVPRSPPTACRSLSRAGPLPDPSGKER